MPYDACEIYVTSDEVEARALETALDAEGIECHVEVIPPKGWPNMPLCVVKIEYLSQAGTAREIRRKLIGS